MQLRGIITTLSLAALTTEASVLVTIFNACSENVELFDNVVIETITPGFATTRVLPEGFAGMFRNGVNPQATLAQFSVAGGALLYNIGIVPTGNVGPGYCSSWEECKAVTGGTGFNTPMQIAPWGCTTVTCLQDGCADACLFPTNDLKTHMCVDSTAVALTFCPEGSTGLPLSDLNPAQVPKQPEIYNADPNAALPTIEPAMTQLPTEAYDSQAYANVDATPPLTTLNSQLPTEPLIKVSLPPLNPVAVTTLATTQDPSKCSMDEPLPVSPVPTPAPSNPTVPTNAPIAPHALVSSTGQGSHSNSNGTSTNTKQKAATTDLVNDFDAKKTSNTSSPVAQTTYSVSSPASNKGESLESVSTQSSSGAKTGAATYAVSILGCCAILAVVAVAAVARKKKNELDAMAVRDEDLMTPVTQINVL
ncbi:hypothetical protein CCR75_008856 [Bremia lactucae]|uniref:Carbohydrate-binding protein n=1 Tax=Bremia lactucae TaxID=4779 RepID=A0A976FLW0_BRELC|nr:hypothetical protein CCR75_008856 [Bremia lactucae]